jgi:hypothetical protein
MVATKIHNEIEFKLGMTQKEYDDFVANVEELFKAASADPSLATKWEPITKLKDALVVAQVTP